MKYLKFGLCTVAMSLSGMEQSKQMAKPYFIENNKKIEMRVPRGWENQLEPGELVTLCADLLAPMKINEIVKKLQTSVDVLNDLFKKVVIGLGHRSILLNCHQDDLTGNSLYVKSQNHYIQTDWYKLGKRYCYGSNYNQALQVFCIVGVHNYEVNVIPIKLYHYQQDRIYYNSRNQAEVVYFEPHEYENDGLKNKNEEVAL